MKRLFYFLIIMLAAFTLITRTFAQSANKTLSNLTSPTAVNQSLLPGSNGAINLGSLNKSWKNIYVTNGYYLNGSKIISIADTENTFIGSNAGKSITTGDYNTATGASALHGNTTGKQNTAAGAEALYNNINGNYNTANGVRALYYNTSGGSNTATGSYALYYNTGSYNTATGSYALYNNSGYENTATGQQALYNNTSGNNNTATGEAALYSNTSGSENTADGYYAMFYNNTGYYNIAVGNYALYSTTSSQYNTAVGYNAGKQYDNGYNNVFIGANTDVNGIGFYNDIAIGQGTLCTDVSQARFGNSATVSIGGYANWTNISDVRVKKNIKQNVPGLAFINKLQPITYNLDLDAADKIVQRPVIKDKDGKIVQPTEQEIDARKAKEKIVYTGFSAQDVEKAAKSLNYDFSGVDAAKNSKDLYGLRYAEFVVPLVKAVQELSTTHDELENQHNEQQKVNQDLQKQIDDLKAKISSNGFSLKLAGKNLPSIVSLEQNIPNPFSNSTIINYTLPKTYSSASIIITDKGGKVLKEVNISGNNKGSIVIDASTLSSGAYQYSLKADGRMIGSKQMILAK